MLRPAIIIGLAAVLLNATQSMAVEVSQISGSCTRFKMGARDLTSDCKPTVLKNFHPNGRVAFLYASQNKIMSFAGNQAEVLFDGVMQTLPVTQVIVSDGGWPHPLNASGSCRYGTKKPGEAYPVVCEVSTSEGRYSAAVIADAVNIHLNSETRSNTMQTVSPVMSFPASMQGVWADGLSQCGGYANQSVKPIRDLHRSNWVEIRGAVMRGGENGRFLRVVNRGVAEATDPENPNVNQEVRLLNDHTLDVAVQGARASAQYVRCPMSGTSVAPKLTNKVLLDLPVSGSYGQVNGQGNPCNDARLEREGDYITFARGKFFHGEFWRSIASAIPNGNGWFQIAVRNANKNLSNTKIYVDPYIARYEGAVFKRCM